MACEKLDFCTYLDRISSGYRQAQVLFAGVKLGIFDQLAHTSCSADELAIRVCCSKRGITILCDALTAIGLIQKEGNLYKNTEGSALHLTTSSALTRVPMILHAANLYDRWAKLETAVRSGTRIETTDEQRSPTAFALAMQVSARDAAAKTADLLDLSSVTHLLDVGGGSGSYTIEFLRRNPTLRATIVDNAETLSVARQNLLEKNLLNRVTLTAADMLTDQLNGEFDLIFLSNVIHMFSEKQNAGLVTKLSSLLASKGRICIKDFLLDETRTAPEWSALFAINMLVNTEGGNCYTAAELKGWLERAGLQILALLELTEQSRLLIGQKA